MTAIAQCKLIIPLEIILVADRIRYSTFLKRKGGLFKKAHELAVLCSVDVAVIIFGHNKKLYEYSSCDMHDALGRYQYVGRSFFDTSRKSLTGKFCSLVLPMSIKVRKISRVSETMTTRKTRFHRPPRTSKQFNRTTPPFPLTSKTSPSST
jgi:hypothetical protein